METFNFEKEIKKQFKSLKENVSLKDFTTFKIGGRAKYFLEVKNEKEFKKALLIANDFKIPFFILGGGSNILVSDKGFGGLVIRFKSDGIFLKKTSKNIFEIFCEAGVLLSKVVRFCLDRSLEGFEWAVGIPGTVGGALQGNAGAFGREIGDVVKSVKVFDVKSKKIKVFKKKECNFKYRESIFKKKRNLIILSAIFKLKKGNKKKLESHVKEYLLYRKKNQPSLPCAGSVFKNPKNVSAKELIEKCGLKGKRIGGAEISKKNPNFIVNVKKAQSEDVIKLIELIEKKVKEKFKIKLKREIQLIGF